MYLVFLYYVAILASTQSFYHSLSEQCILYDREK